MEGGDTLARAMCPFFRLQPTESVLIGGFGNGEKTKVLLIFMPQSTDKRERGA